MGELEKGLGKQGESGTSPTEADNKVADEAKRKASEDEKRRAEKERKRREIVEAMRRAEQEKNVERQKKSRRLTQMEEKPSPK
jgi:colicin import membrane protein